MSRPARPTRPPLYVETIPADLTVRFQWVVWCYDWDNKREKWTKVPYQAKPRKKIKAKSTKRETWVAYARALEVCQEDGWGGIGFVFAEDDNRCGIDLDEAYDNEGRLKDWAKEIVEHFASYAECSPSGTGLHIIIAGKLPGGGRRRGNIEVYDRGRYFTVTGAHEILSPLTVENRQEELDAFLEKWLAPKVVVPTPPGDGRVSVPALDFADDELLAKAFAARNGWKIENLYQGDVSGYDSASEADEALCVQLAFYTRDRVQLDRLFRSSALMRSKWDVRHYGDGRTYGEGTIDAALAFSTTSYSPNGSNGLRQSWGEEDSSESAYSDEAPPAKPRAPALPDEAMAVYDYLRDDTGGWLREYVDYAMRASAMTPESFHVAAALFMGAVAIARRLCLRVARTAIYPNLFLLFIAPSTLYSKTIAFDLCTSLFREANLKHLLLPQSMTTEAMVEELSLSVPGNFAAADAETRGQWLRERAFAAQRGWAIDEAHSLLDSFKRDYKAGIMAMLLGLYECPEDTTEQSKSKWRVAIRRAYLNFFGATTPASLTAYLHNPHFWANGLWPRFALIAPDAPPVWSFWPEPMDTPYGLVSGLKRMVNLFPVPRAELAEVEGPDGKARQAIQLQNLTEPASALFDKGVWQAWETYSRATRFDMVRGQEVEEQLYPSYGRMGTQAIKVAMILATMDTQTLPVRITLPHFAHAQSIVEQWREALYQLQYSGGGSDENTLQDKVLKRVLQLPDEGGLIREVYRPLGVKAKECREALIELQAAGYVELFQQLRNGRKVDMVKRGQFTQFTQGRK